MRFLLILQLTLYLMAPSLPGQSDASSLTVGPMQVNWEHDGEDLRFTILSPRQGWVALGTNVKNDILGASLYMGGILETTNEIYFSERRTVRFGKHEAKKALGEPERAHMPQAHTSSEGTTLSFLVRATPDNEEEHDLRPGRHIWLILAYSVSDDLGHHSRFRRHVRVRL